jgi:hypothetical protein
VATKTSLGEYLTGFAEIRLKSDQKKVRGISLQSLRFEGEEYT